MKATLLWMAHCSHSKLVNFNFPDPIADLNSHFCPIDEFMETHLTVKCSNSAYSDSVCKFSCPNGMSLLGPGDGKDSCKCDSVTKECDWEGSTRFSDCYEEESLFNLTKIFDHELKLHPGVLLKSANEMSPDFQEEYDDSWIDEFEGMAYEDLPYKTNRHFSHLAKNKRNEARQAYHVELRSKYRKAQKLLAERNGQEVPDDVPLVLQSRGLEIPEVFQINDSGCKELELPNGKVECFKDEKQVFGEEKFAKGVECRNSCNQGYRLHGNSPAVKKCICRSKIGCKWIKGLRAKCRRIPGSRIESKEPEELLKSCVAIENGKKKLTRNQNCSCPPGWSLKDKCFTPITNATSPCRFTDTFETNGQAVLDCSNVVDGPYPNIGFTVPGITTRLNMKNSQIRGFTVDNLLAGAYRLEYLDISHNLLREIPRNFFQNNHIMKTLIMSNNQIRSLRPEVFQPMKQIEILDLSNNQLQTFNKKLMKFASKLKVLKLNGNNIGPSLQKWAFHKLPQLTDLDLSENAIKSVMGVTFQKSKKLAKVNFAKNKIAKLKASMFDKQQTSLKTIDFGYNRIDYMTKQFLQAIPHVESLNMESNLLKNLKKETFFPSRKILKLNLNGNKIQSFPDVLFWPHGCTLKAFFAKENNVQFMNQQVLANCTDLRHLFLSQNQIEKIPPKLLEKKSMLKTIDLSRNKLASIPKGFVKHATNLENVYLNENFLEQIPIDILNNPNIKVLDLANNNLQNSTDILSEVANHKLKSGPSHLTTINLKNNDNLGELADLYHNDNSWYYKYNQMASVVESPFDVLKNRITSQLKPQRERVFDIIQRKLELAEENDL